MAGTPIRPTGGGSLTRDSSVALNAAGVGEVELGPVPPNQIWLISRMTVFVTGTTVPMPSCSVYDGPASPGNLVDATWTGAQDVSDFGTPYVLEANESLLFRWEGGTPGAIATARLVGRTQAS